MRGSGFLPLSISAEQRALAESLAQRAKGGDSEAFGSLLVLYEDLLLASCRRIVRKGEDPEQIALEILGEVCADFHSWEMRSSLHTWVSRVAYNVVSRHRLKPERAHLGLDENWNGDPSEFRHLWPGRLSGKTEGLREALMECLEGLPPRERQVTEMRFGGYGTADIAETLGLSAGTVRATLSHAYEKLRRLMQE